jgi:hypothetical protein
LTQYFQTIPLMNVCLNWLHAVECAQNYTTMQSEMIDYFSTCAGAGVRAGLNFPVLREAHPGHLFPPVSRRRKTSLSTIQQPPTPVSGREKPRAGTG